MHITDNFNRADRKFQTGQFRLHSRGKLKLQPEQILNLGLVLKWSRTLWGSWAGKPFCAPHLLTFPEFHRAGSNSANQAREGMQRQRMSSQKTTVRPWQGPGSTSRDTHDNIFELFYRTKSPNELGVVLMKCSSFQREGHTETSSGYDSVLPLQGGWFQSLVQELRFHMLQCSQKKKEEEERNETKQKEIP